MVAVGNPLATVPYWRASLQGITAATATSFCKRAYVREMPWKAEEPMTVAYHLSWV